MGIVVCNTPKADARQPSPGLAAGLSGQHPAKPQAQPGVFGGGPPRKQRVVLKQDPDIGRAAADCAAKERDPAGGGLDEPGDSPE
jgi:hypothetical protein